MVSTCTFSNWPWSHRPRIQSIRVVAAVPRQAHKPNHGSRGRKRQEWPVNVAKNALKRHSDAHNQVAVRFALRSYVLVVFKAPQHHARHRPVNDMYGISSHSSTCQRPTLSTCQRACFAPAPWPRPYQHTSVQPCLHQHPMLPVLAHGRRTRAPGGDPRWSPTPRAVSPSGVINLAPQCKT